MYGVGFKLTLHISAETDLLVLPGRPLPQQQQQLLSEPVEWDNKTTPASVTRRLLHFIDNDVYPSAILSSVNSRRVQFILPYAPSAAVSVSASSFSGSAMRSLPAVLSVFDRLDAAKTRLLSEYRIQEWGRGEHSTVPPVCTYVRAHSS